MLPTPRSTKVYWPNCRLSRARRTTATSQFVGSRSASGATLAAPSAGPPWPSGTRAGSRGRRVLLEHLGQHHGIIVLLIARAVDNRHGPVPGSLGQPLQRRAALRHQQFGAVAPAEFIPLGGIVPEPAAQRGRDG